jgi:hypothetical protein
VQPPFHPHPTRASRFPKILPWLVLPEYEHTIWIDANMRLKTEAFADEVLACLDNGAMALFAHPDRATVAAEAEHSARMSKYADEPNLEQATAYRRKGFPDDVGLFACGVIARNRDNHDLDVIGWPWMIENLVWSHLDQLSLPYVIWRYGVPLPRLFPWNLWDNHWFELVPHLR